VKRPGTGPIAAERFESILGKRASRDIPADTHLAEDDVQP
jgi:sialic acid synthase SpsE